MSSRILIAEEIYSIKINKYLSVQTFRRAALGESLTTCLSTREEEEGAPPRCKPWTPWQLGRLKNQHSTEKPSATEKFGVRCWLELSIHRFTSWAGLCLMPTLHSQQIWEKPHSMNGLQPWLNLRTTWRPFQNPSSQAVPPDQWNQNQGGLESLVFVCLGFKNFNAYFNMYFSFEA